MEIDRRKLIAGGLTALAGAWAAPALAQPPRPAKLLDPPPLPPETARLDILRGYRPFRKAGPRLGFVAKGSGTDKLTRAIVHNYGHGGGGITLAWGYARDAAELVLANRATILNNEVIVLGAGIIGLTTAFAILDRTQQSNVPLRVSLYARDTLDGHGDYEGITSSIAGGQFAPSITGLSDSDPGLRRRLEVSAATYLQHLDWGVFRRPNYSLAEAPDLHLVERIVNPRSPAAGSFERLPIEGLRCAGFGYNTLLIEPPRYLRALWRRLKSNPAFAANEIQLRSARDLNGLRDTLIVNCLGLGARAIVGEAGSDFFGREGQIVRYAPAGYDPSRYQYLYSGIGYVFPRSDYLVIGGSVDGPSFGEGEKQTVLQAYGHHIVRVHRQVFAGRIPVAAGFPRAFSGASRGARARCFA